MPQDKVVKFSRRLRSLDEFPSSAIAFGQKAQRTTPFQKVCCALLIAAAFALGYLA